MNDLARSSVAIITAAQAPSGAILAAPTFPVYRYCWFRDASFTAYAMDRVGKPDVSARFFQWGHAIVQRHRDRVERALERHERGESFSGNDLLHCRYTVDGAEGSEQWGNFQMDGYGTYLWALAHHLRRTGAQFEPYLPTIRLLARYIMAFWGQPQYDCWEEAEGRYPATLACLFGGLRAILPLLPPPEAAAASAAAEAMRAAVLGEGVHQGRLAKSLGGRAIDASLLWCVVPFDLVQVTHPVALETVRTVERELLDGGVHRFRDDTYYGGGAWILLTAWLGWAQARAGRLADAEQLLDWIERQPDPHGALPEQVQDSLFAPAFFDVWVDRWGAPACPLIWSHAMYLVLRQELRSMQAKSIDRSQVAAD